LFADNPAKVDAPVTPKVPPIVEFPVAARVPYTVVLFALRLFKFDTPVVPRVPYTMVLFADNPAKVDAPVTPKVPLMVAFIAWNAFTLV
jgi:hypothetical protein